MIGRSMILVIGSLLLCAATEPPPPPAELEPYIVDGRYDPGDYAWTKGRFQDASPEEAAAFQAIMRWASDCRTAAIAELREQLAAEGVSEASLENAGVGPHLCRAVGFQPMVADDSSFDTFRQEAALALPLAQAYLTATAHAVRTVRPETGDLARQLETRIVGEQVVRHGLTWVLNPDLDFPEMSPLGRAIFQSRIGLAMNEYDHANTEWLKGIVAQNGWPKISEVGEMASNSAWLLVQHADADPLFQLRALRLMEPLVAEKEVMPQSYAYLYDRVMLKLAGKQRYGTQFTCVDGAFAPLPLEDVAAADRFRSEAGMETLAENTARMTANYGRCGTDN